MGEDVSGFCGAFDDGQKSAKDVFAVRGDFRGKNGQENQGE